MGMEKTQRQFWENFWQRRQEWGEWDEVSQLQYDALKILFPQNLHLSHFHSIKVFFGQVKLGRPIALARKQTAAISYKPK